MADKKKSILEEAILDAKRIQEALNANTKEILRSVAKEEIESLVKESLEEDYTEEDVEDNDTDEIEADAEAGTEEIELDDIEGDNLGDDLDGDDVAGDIEVDDIDTSDVGGDLEGDYETGMDAVASDDELEMDMTTASDDDVIAVYKKLTGDDEIEVVVDDEAGEVKLTVNEPGEFVIKTNDAGGAEDMDLDDMGGDTDIDLDDMGGDVDVDDLAIDPVGDALDTDVDAGIEGDAPEEIGGEEEVMYEIALDEDTKIGATANGKPRTATSDVEKSMTGDIETGDIDKVTAPVGKESDDNWAGDNLEGGFTEEDPNGSSDGHAEHVMNEEEVAEVDEAEGDEDLEEVIRKGVGMSVGKHANEKATASIAKDIVGAGASVNESEVIKKYNKLLTEAKGYKSKNEEYKQALKQFRTMLAETVVFNSNLTYTTKLFMEHSTTRVEKENIFKRFDNEVSTLKESKKLYKSIASELGSRKPMNESIGNKIDKEASSGVSKQLSESTVYFDTETSRIKDLMNRVNNK